MPPPVLADPVQFEQVLLNLCLNARDAIGEHGTIRLRIVHAPAWGHCASCSVRLDGGRWVGFEVADDGRGMTQDVVDRMFEPFFTTKEIGRGTGMGLAMVHGILHDHGGHIQVSTAPGRGSSFRVLLPVAEDMSETARLEPPPAAATTTPQLRGRVLLVEDEPMVSGFMRDLMQHWGLEVVLESDPRAAARLLAATEEPFALMLTDQTMPGADRASLARQAQRQRPGLPVLLYTGNAFDIDEQELADSGVTRLLRKPIDTAALRPTLGQLLRQEVPGALISPGLSGGWSLHAEPGGLGQAVRFGPERAELRPRHAEVAQGPAVQPLEFASRSGVAPCGGQPTADTASRPRRVAEKKWWFIAGSLVHAALAGHEATMDCAGNRQAAGQARPVAFVSATAESAPWNGARGCWWWTTTRPCAPAARLSRTPRVRDRRGGHRRTDARGDRARTARCRAAGHPPAGRGRAGAGALPARTL